MTTLHMHANIHTTPGQFVAAVTDFGPGRSELFGNSDDSYLKVHANGVDHADVTEGSGGVWERLAYDWSNTRRLAATTTDSNTRCTSARSASSAARNAAQSANPKVKARRVRPTSSSGRSWSCWSPASCRRFSTRRRKP